jgi:hypothetical protein
MSLVSFRLSGLSIYLLSYLLFPCLLNILLELLASYLYTFIYVNSLIMYLQKNLTSAQGCN